MAGGDVQRQRQTTKGFGQLSRLRFGGHVSVIACGFGLVAQQLDGIFHQQRFHFDPRPGLTTELAHARGHQHRATGQTLHQRGHLFGLGITIHVFDQHQSRMSAGAALQGGWQIAADVVDRPPQVQPVGQIAQQRIGAAHGRLVFARRQHQAQHALAAGRFGRRWIGLQPVSGDELLSQPRFANTRHAVDGAADHGGLGACAADDRQQRGAKLIEFVGASDECSGGWGEGCDGFGDKLQTPITRTAIQLIIIDPLRASVRPLPRPHLSRTQRLRFGQLDIHHQQAVGIALMFVQAAGGENVQRGLRVGPALDQRVVLVAVQQQAQTVVTQQALRIMGIGEVGQWMVDQADAPALQRLAIGAGHQAADLVVGESQFAGIVVVAGQPSAVETDDVQWGAKTEIERAAIAKATMWAVFRQQMR